MRSRMVREGSVGLLILLSAGLFVGLAAWIKGLNPANRSFTIVVDFPTLSGVQVGSPVRYRGVSVGRIAEIHPGPNGVEVKMTIAPADLIIPKDADISINQSSLLGESVVDISPRASLDASQVAAKPLDANCDQSKILCQGSRIKGQVGISTEELIRNTIEFTNAYSNPDFVKNLNQLTQNSSVAAAEIVKVSREFGGLARAARQELGTVSATTQSTAQNFAQTARSLGLAANQANLTLGQVNSLLASNRATLVSTLENLNQTSNALKVTVTRLTPAVDRLASGQLLQNLETLSDNAAKASVNLRQASQSLNDPANLAMLQQTLDSARATFQNAQKITADLDDLVGDPTLRKNLRNLINGLSGLVSSSNQLQQQAQVAQMLAPLTQAKTEAQAMPILPPTLPEPAPSMTAIAPASTPAPPTPQ